MPCLTPQACPRWPVLAFSLLPLAGAVAAANEDASGTVAPGLETVTVVGTRTERTLDEVEATISVYGREEIERQKPEGFARVIGPAPCPFLKLRQWFRHQATLQASNAKTLAAVLDGEKASAFIEKKHNQFKIIVDVDPSSML